GKAEGVPREHEAPRWPWLNNQPRAEDERRNPGHDVEVAAGIAHLYRHQPFDVRAMHEQLDANAESLVADEGGQRKAERDALADGRERELERNEKDQNEQHQHRRWRLEMEQATCGGDAGGRDPESR